MSEQTTKSGEHAAQLSDALPVNHQANLSHSAKIVGALESALEDAKGDLKKAIVEVNGLRGLATERQSLLTNALNDLQAERSKVAGLTSRAQEGMDMLNREAKERRSAQYALSEALETDARKTSEIGTLQGAIEVKTARLLDLEAQLARKDKEISKQADEIAWVKADLAVAKYEQNRRGTALKEALRYALVFGSSAIGILSVIYGVYWVHKAVVTDDWNLHVKEGYVEVQYPGMRDTVWVKPGQQLPEPTRAGK